MVNKYKQFQDTMQEILNSKAYSKFEKNTLVDKIIKEKSELQRSEFHDMLRKTAKLDRDDVQVSDVKKPKENIKEIKPEDIDVKKQIKNPDSIDSEIPKENEIVSSDSKVDAVDQREESFKYMYTTALKQYFNLRERIYKKQLNENDISLEDDSYIKLLEYENFLRKCDSTYKLRYGSFIGQKHEEIGQLENKLTYNSSLYAIKLISDHQKAIARVDELNARIEEKADDIIMLNEAFEKGNVKEYQTRIELLEKDYIDLNVEMSLLTPNILELYRQEQIKEEQDEYSVKVLGTVYEKSKKQKVLNTDVVRADKKIDAKMEGLNNDVEDEKKELNQIGVELATSYIDAAEAALKRHDSVTALDLISKAQEIVPENTFEDIIEDNSADLKEALEKDIEYRSNQRTNRDVDDELESAKKQVEDQER